jgi:catechol 2,3-dioxygenase-like lactoylglutathione lyase family enzyme
MAAKPLAQLPLRLHHQAFAVADQEKTRQFMEEVLGIPLVATWCEKVFRPEVGREVEYCHTFYELADGGAIAFFQYADEECWEMNRPQPAKRGDAGALHSAFKATKETQDEIRARLERAAFAHRFVDHGYCQSLYVTSPDGVRLEFTVDAPDVEAIARMRRADAHAELRRWLSGDRRTNNEDRPQH